MADLTQIGFRRDAVRSLDSLKAAFMLEQDRDLARLAVAYALHKELELDSVQDMGSRERNYNVNTIDTNDQLLRTLVKVQFAQNDRVQSRPYEAVEILMNRGVIALNQDRVSLNDILDLAAVTQEIDSRELEVPEGA
jgi:hypothetical protein